MQSIDRPAINIEVFEKPSQLKITPKGTRRSVPSWDLWVNGDGSGTISFGTNQFQLPKNEKSQTRDNAEIIKCLIAKRVHPECVEYVKAELEK